jgi:hypothetical protein
MTPFTIYLWQQADSLKSALGTAAFPCFVIGFIGTVATCIALTMEDDPEAEGKMRQLRKWSVGSLAIGFFLASLAFLVPSSKTIAMMVAIPAIANSEPIQKDLPELYQLAKDALKEQITGKSTK